MLIHFVSLGCDKNLVDSEIMLGILNEDGHTVTSVEEEADVIVVNTCGFVADASSEGVEAILRLAEHKKTGRCKALVVTGCMAQRYTDEIFSELPEVDAIVGVGDFEAIARVVAEAATGRRVRLVTDKNRVLDEAYAAKRVLSVPCHFAYVKIAEGCDNHCAYCTIPSIRGKYRSRNVESVLAEAARLAGQGVKELVLVAQDTARYGEDLYGENRLHALLASLSGVPGVEWIRLMYAYPEHITPETIGEMARNPKVCHYIDMPMQHADDGVLKRMGRAGSRADLERVIANLRKSMPGISLRTTVIVGFPGETEEEFEQLRRFVTQIKFDKLGVFEYSKEEGTVAASMKNQVPKKEKRRRLEIIMRTQKEISRETSARFVGSTLKVIVDGRLPEQDMYCGRSCRDAYDIDGTVFFEYDGELLTGDFVPVTITGNTDYDLLGHAESAEGGAAHELA